MNSDDLLQWLLSVGLLSVRLTVALALSPLLSSFGIPVIARILLTLALSLLMLANHAAAPLAAEWIANPIELIGPVVVECVIGGLMGLSVQVVLAAFAIAGRMMDVQIGFAIGSIFDPVTRTRSNVMGSILGVLGVMMFFGGGGYLEVIGLLARSIDIFPLGHMPEFDQPMKPIVAAGGMFVLAVALASPLAIALLLSDIAVGVASRTMPQMNVLMLSIPIKALIAYAVLSMTVTSWSPMMRNALDRMAASIGAA